MAAQRSYTETEKLGTMMLALDAGITAAAQETNTPAPTIYDWFRDGGGIVRIRKFADAALLNARLASHRAIYDAIGKRAPELKDSVLSEMLRILERAGDEHADQAGAQAGAQASAIVIQISPDEVIEVPRERQA